MHFKLHLRPLCPDGKWSMGPPLFFLPQQVQMLYTEQLFHVPHAQSLMRSYICAGETFPVHFLLLAVSDLDLCVRSFLYHAVRWGWNEMSSSLVTLAIQTCTCLWLFCVCSPIKLSLFQVTLNILMMMGSICHWQACSFWKTWSWWPQFNPLAKSYGVSLAGLLCRRL